MRFEVRLTADAVRDLEEIEEWIALRDGAARAARVVRQIESAIVALKSHPARGSHPTELLELGLREYRETLLKPYRIIYRIDGRQVYVYLVADGRRDMQALLSRRLLEA